MSVVVVVHVVFFFFFGPPAVPKGSRLNCFVLFARTSERPSLTCFAKEWLLGFSGFFKEKFYP